MNHRLLTLIVSLLLTAHVFAGDGDIHAGFSVGTMYPRIAIASIQLDKELRYHSAIETYIAMFSQWDTCPDCGKICSKSFHTRYGFSLGAAYKPALLRARNFTGRIRMGTDVGTNTGNFMLGVEVGAEMVWTYRSGIQFVLLQQNKVNFWAKPRFTNGVAIGLRIPF